MIKVCIECGEEKEMFEGTEIKEPKMCIGCYASMVGFIYKHFMKWTNYLIINYKKRLLMQSFFCIIVLFFIGDLKCNLNFQYIVYKGKLLMI